MDLFILVNWQDFFLSLRVDVYIRIKTVFFLCVVCVCVWGGYVGICIIVCQVYVVYIGYPLRAECSSAVGWRPGVRTPALSVSH